MAVVMSLKLVMFKVKLCMKTASVFRNIVDIFIWNKLIPPHHSRIQSCC